MSRLCLSLADVAGKQPFCVHGLHQTELTSPYNISLVPLSHGNRSTGLGETIHMSKSYSNE